jgi:uncharacterized peroxidase-related enzyme
MVDRRHCRHRCCMLGPAVGAHLRSKHAAHRFDLRRAGDPRLAALLPGNGPPAERAGRGAAARAGHLDPGEREPIAAYVSALNHCRYCASSHGACAAAELPGGMAVVEQVRADPASAPVPAKLKTLLTIAAAVARSGHAVTNEYVARARAAGATDVEIHDTVLIAATFCMFNRYVDGLDTTTPDDPAVYATGARRLVTQGYLPPPADPGRAG